MVHLKLVLHSFLVSLTGLYSLPAENVDRGGRIVGGSKVVLGEFPWQVSLQMTSKETNFTFKHYCGGTLIHPRFVLTAAHCVYLHTTRKALLGPSSLRVIMGTLDREDTNKSAIAVTKIIMHLRFTIFTMENDIALLMLEKSVNSVENLRGRIGYAELPPATFQPQGNCKVSGWGYTKSSAGEMSETLMAATVSYVPFKVCRRAYRGVGFILDSMLCAGDANADACQFDSGGPLVCPGTKTDPRSESSTFSYRSTVASVPAANDGTKYYLSGIVSWGNGCANPGYPGVYTNVSKYVPWISANMAKSLGSLNSSLVTTPFGV